MYYLPYRLLQRQVIKTTTLMAKQYHTFAGMYANPLESQAKIFEQLIHYRYHLETDQSTAQALLPQCTTLLDLRELIIEVLDQENEFNSLDIKQQIAFENCILEILERKGISC